MLSWKLTLISQTNIGISENIYKYQFNSSQYYPLLDNLTLEVISIDFFFCKYLLVCLYILNFGIINEK